MSCGVRLQPAQAWDTGHTRVGWSLLWLLWPGTGCCRDPFRVLLLGARQERQSWFSKNLFLGQAPHPHPSLITFPGQPLSGKVWSRVLSFIGCSTCYLGKCGSSKNLNIFQHMSVTRTELRVTQCPSKPQMWFRNLVVAWMLFLGLRPSEESTLPQTALAFLCKGVIFQQQRK